MDAGRWRISAFHPPVATTEPLLEIKALSKHFGGIKAVQNLDLTICKGDVAVLIGSIGRERPPFERAERDLQDLFRLDHLSRP